MKRVILVPYRPDGGRRTRNWTYLEPIWMELGWPIYAASGPAGKFSRAHALNEAAAYAGDWDTAVCVDADQMVGNPLQVIRAVEEAETTGFYVAAHDVQHYLTELGTRQVISGEKDLAKAQERNPVGLTWEGVTVVPRGLWEEIGGHDERFIGYGGEGLAFYFAAACLRGATRVAGAIYHFEHQEGRDNDDPQLAENLNLAERYRQSIYDRAEMRAILREEGRR